MQAAMLIPQEWLSGGGGSSGGGRQPLDDWEHALDDAAGSGFYDLGWQDVKKEAAGRGRQQARGQGRAGARTLRTFSCATTRIRRCPRCATDGKSVTSRRVYLYIHCLA